MQYAKNLIFKFMEKSWVLGMLEHSVSSRFPEILEFIPDFFECVQLAQMRAILEETNLQAFQKIGLLWTLECGVFF